MNQPKTELSKEQILEDWLKYESKNHGSDLTLISKSQLNDLIHFSIQSHDKELMEKIEGKKEYCHDNNHQRGCVNCINKLIYNDALDQVLNLFQSNREGK